MSTEYARRHATLRSRPRPFALRPLDAIDVFPRPPATLKGEAIRATFELPPTGPGTPEGLTVELRIDLATYRAACARGAWGLDEAPLDATAFEGATPINVLLRADLDAIGRGRFSGLDLADDQDLREAFASVLGDGRGNVFHAIESWQAVSVRQFVPDRPPVGFDLPTAGEGSR